MLKSLLLVLCVYCFVSCKSILTFGAAGNENFFPIDSSSVKLLKNLSISKIQNLYFKKCGFGYKVLANCFLTERDIRKNGRTDFLILFRGEPLLYPKPAVSSYYRWAIGKTGYCKISCKNSELMYQLNFAIQKLLPVFHTSAEYNAEEQSWRVNNRIDLLPLEKEKISALEIIATTHKQGSGLYFKGEQHQKFDPLVSFSLDPQVATSFAKTYNRKGILYLVAIPISEIIVLDKVDCLTLNPEIGKVYDLNICMQDLVNQAEVELNSFHFLPSVYFYGKIIGL